MLYPKDYFWLYDIQMITPPAIQYPKDYSAGYLISKRLLKCLYNVVCCRFISLLPVPLWMAFLFFKLSCTSFFLKENLLLPIK